MLEKLIALIKKALWQEGEKNLPVDDVMTSNIDLWESIYTDDAPWVDNDKVVSIGIAKTICQTLASQVLSEVEIKIEGNGEELSPRAQYLEEQIEKHLLPNLKQKIEKAMATGGMVFRPYINGNDVNIDFCRQGEFVPLGFDDDGKMIDVAFEEHIIDGKITYTRIERQSFDGETDLISNTAYQSKSSTLGNKIKLEDVDEWKDIDDDVLFNYDNTMYGYYKVPIANNVDMDSPLGISVFAPAINLIKKADHQFSRLDWEYEGGQMAIDITEDAIIDGQMDDTTDRLYRQVDSQDTYKVFNPSLRDTNFQSGLQEYKKNIEDTVGLSRGSISDPTSDVRTATEMRILKQRSYNTLKDNQTALEKALIDLIDAMAFLSQTYQGVDGEYNITINWNDSVLEDYQTELNRHLQLMDAGIESRVEVRMWAMGETKEVAIEKLNQIDDGIEDIYSDLDSQPTNLDEPQGEEPPIAEGEE